MVGGEWGILRSGEKFQDGGYCNWRIILYFGKIYPIFLTNMDLRKANLFADLKECIQF